MIIYFRHGSIQDSSKVWLKLKDIQELTGVKLRTISQTLTTFHRTGEVPDNQHHLRGRKPKLSQEMLDYLKDPEILRKWAPHSIEKRCVLFHRKFPEVKIGRTALARYYKKLGISFTQAKYHYRSFFEQEESILEQRQQF